MPIIRTLKANLKRKLVALPCHKNVNKVLENLEKTVRVKNPFRNHRFHGG